jgi:predicted XRE-type DNA-binding protein
MPKNSIRKKGEIQHERSSGNVFEDVGLPQDYLAKAAIVARIDEIIVERKITQAKAAELMGLDQPRVSLLLRGKLNLFSLEKLLTLVSLLGNRVEITIKPADIPAVCVMGSGHAKAFAAGAGYWSTEATDDSSGGSPLGTAWREGFGSASTVAGEIIICEQTFPYWEASNSTEDREEVYSTCRSE